jgi:hypothetical protein
MVDPVIDDRIDNDDHSTAPAPLAQSVPQDGHFTASVLLDTTQILHVSSVVEMISECAFEIYEAFLRVRFTIANALYEACSTLFSGKPRRRSVSELTLSIVSRLVSVLLSKSRDGASYYDFAIHVLHLDSAHVTGHDSIQRMRVRSRRFHRAIPRLLIGWKRPRHTLKLWLTRIKFSIVARA